MYNYKRNGFTLVELMAVIVIISLIALLTFPNIINQIKKTKKSNNKMIEDVVIEQAKKYVSDNKDELLEDEYCMPISTLIDNDYIKEDFVNINDIKDNKVVHITLDNNNSYEVVDKNKCFLSAVKYLLKKTNPITVTNYTDGDIHEMYTFEHEATEQTPALTDYRYIGSDPNNYVEFNNELWRIIGVFKVEDESGKWQERIKIVREESIGNMAWDTNNVNDWTIASLNIYLNVDYYNSISDKSRNMIESTKYYLSGLNNTNYNGMILYNYERDKNTDDERQSSWIGKLALMYPSDYYYGYSLGVDNICFTNVGYSGCSDTDNMNENWMFFSGYTWLLTHNNRSKSNPMIIMLAGYLNQYFTSKSPYSIRPILYLSSKVKITSGDGTKDNAYKLSM